MANEKIYVHEFIDIIGPNRAKYMHHMTANWCPIAREERRQLCFGVWGTIGSTGRWPEVVNLWEIDGWDGLAHDLTHEVNHAGMQDPALAQWWREAAQFRRGGFDRILVPEPWSPTIGECTAAGIRGEVYAHELVKLPAGGVSNYLEAVRDIALMEFELHHLTLVGAFRTAMVSDDEAIVVWAIPSFATWIEFEHGFDQHAGLRAWRARQDVLGARVHRTLLVDAPLSPLRIRRQPEISDRLPFDEV
jgi:hypothetical protein